MAFAPRAAAVVMGVLLALSYPVAQSLAQGSEAPSVHSTPPWTEDEVLLSGDSAILWTLQSDGAGSVDLQVTMDAIHASRAARATWFWHENEFPGDLHHGVTTTGTDVAGHAQVGAVDPLLRTRGSATCLVNDQVFDNQCGFELTGRWFPHQPGNWTLLLVLGANNEWSGPLHLITTGAGLTITSRNIYDAEYLTDEDFAGDFNLGVVNGQQLTTVKAMSSTEAVRNLHSGLMGFFLGTKGIGSLSMGYDNVDTGASFSNATFYRFDGLPSGNYRFRVDQAIDASSPYISPSSGVNLLIADVAIAN